jgi:hypothetical protein
MAMGPTLSFAPVARNALPPCGRPALSFQGSLRSHKESNDIGLNSPVCSCMGSTLLVLGHGLNRRMLLRMMWDMARYGE